MSTSKILDRVQLDPEQRKALLPDTTKVPPPINPLATKTHPRGSNGDENASVYFIGTATTILEWNGIRIMTDPNFLHQGDHVHLGPGVTAQRQTNPAVDLEDLPPLDAILLSHYHADHFDQLVEDSINRDFFIITTPHAKQCLSTKDDPFTNITALDFFDALDLSITNAVEQSQKPLIRVTGMPGKHVPPGPLAVANDLLGAVPPTNGWMLELGYEDNQGDTSMHTGYRIYITGDTLMVDDLKKIPEWLHNERIDLMLIHLGGTTIPGPSMPLLMVTMDAKQGIQMIRLMDPELTIPIHYDDYDVFMSPLSDFTTAVEEAGFKDRVVTLNRGEKYEFKVQERE